MVQEDSMLWCKRIACYGARDIEKEQFDDAAISMMGHRDNLQQ
jgi:hypothetical protein